MKKIPFNRPFIVGKELHYISEAVHAGHLAGNGAFTKKCQAWMEERFGARRVLLTHSCTAALEMAVMLCDIGPGDEVIMPAFTFVSTANAVLLRGGRPVFVDIRDDTMNLDERLIEEAITPQTKAILPVHYAGVACEMDAILDIAARHGLRVIEDAAQGVSARYKKRCLGTLGDLGCWSFHETKNYISGEGGALVINDETLIDRAEVLRDKGTNRARFFKGEVDKYTWVDIGSSYLPSELVAAFLCAQLEEADRITAKRRRIHEYYSRRLAPLQERGLLRLPRVPACCEHNSHMFYVLLENEQVRDDLISQLKRKDISAVFHYVPLHTSPMGRKLGYAIGMLPVTEDSSRRLIRLPCYYELAREDQKRVVAELVQFFGCTME